MASGPLANIKVIEMAGIGPAPYCGMLLADMGAEIIRVVRPSKGDLAVDLPEQFDPTLRGKRKIVLDLKKPESVVALRDLLKHADMLIEGHRPGVMERLGLGPEICLTENPALVYGRVTGWGQTGPLAQRAGHDINYIALSGALYSIGEEGGAPLPPLNLVGDFGGGAMFLALGMTAALLNAQRTGSGQVVDASMLDGTISMLAQTYGLLAAGQWTEQRGCNVLDGAAPWYGAYGTSDGRYMSVGAVEERFWLELLEGLGLDSSSLPSRYDAANWPVLRDRIAKVFSSQSMSYWENKFAMTNACVFPVLTLSEAALHPHNVARNSYVDSGVMLQPAPAPKFEATPSSPRFGEADNSSVDMPYLMTWGMAASHADTLLQRAR